ncbi:MAG TPA: hypothetical protein VF266_04525 [Thermoanaerobaculia bacterium]
MFLIEPTADDAPEFLGRVNAIVALAVRARPVDLYVVRIDHWFGAKWAGFAGKVAGLAGVRDQSHLVIPPFVPSRVLRQSCFRLSAETLEYVETECAMTLHVEQSSSANLRRRLEKLLPGAAMIWFSGDSASFARGSVMAYVPSPDGHVPWYADFNGARGWAASELVNLTQRELERP